MTVLMLMTVLLHECTLPPPASMPAPRLVVILASALYYCKFQRTAHTPAEHVPDSASRAVEPGRGGCVAVHATAVSMLTHPGSPVGRYLHSLQAGCTPVHSAGVVSCAYDGVLLVFRIFVRTHAGANDGAIGSRCRSADAARTQYCSRIAA